MSLFTVQSLTAAVVL